MSWLGYTNIIKSYCLDMWIVILSFSLALGSEEKKHFIKYLKENGYPS